MYFCLQATHPPPVQFFPLVEQHDADLTRGWFSTGRLKRLHGLACHDAGQPPGNTPWLGSCLTPHSSAGRLLPQESCLEGCWMERGLFACLKVAPASSLLLFFFGLLGVFPPFVWFGVFFKLLGGSRYPNILVWDALGKNVIPPTTAGIS